MNPKDDGFDEEELIRSEFESMVSGLSLDESSTSTYLDELDQIDRSDRFVAPNHHAHSFFQQSAQSNAGLSVVITKMME